MVYFMMLSHMFDCVLLNSRAVKELLKYLNITWCFGRDCCNYMDYSKHLTFYLEDHTCILYISTGKISP